MFNSLIYAKRLEKVGLTREQAETHVQMVAEIMETNLATKQDMKDLEGRFHAFTLDIENRFERFATDIRNQMALQEYRLTIKLGTIVSLAVGIAVTLSKLL
jgi:hypothetical protein